VSVQRLGVGIGLGSGVRDEGVGRRRKVLVGSLDPILADNLHISWGLLDSGFGCRGFGFRFRFSVLTVPAKHLHSRSRYAVSLGCRVKSVGVECSVHRFGLMFGVWEVV